MKKAVIYCRVSSTDQANKDTSIPTQKKMLKKYAKENNMQIVKEYIDAGFSAYKDTGSRKNFLEMIADAKEKPKPFDTILYCYNDRVFRNMDDAVAYRSILRKKCGIELICITQDFDVSTPHGQLMERFMDAIAEWDSASKGERIKAVMDSQAEKGIALGEPPYGYMIDKDTGKFAIYEPEAEIVKYIYDEYINGGSLRSIGVDLRKNGKKMFGEAAVIKISKAVENQGKHKSHKLTWRPTTIRNILRKSTYTGCFEWDGKVIENNHPAIISSDTFELANTLLDNKTTTKRKSKDYLLKDLVRCHECGGSLSQLTRTHYTKEGEKRIYRKLRCSKHVRTYDCYYNYNDMYEVENSLISFLKGIESGRVNYKEVKIDKSNNPLINRINQLESKLEGFDEQFDRQMEAFQAGIIDIDQLKKYKEKLIRDKDAIKADLAEAKNKLNNDDYSKEIFLEKLSKTIEALESEDATLQDKKNHLQMLIRDIEISRDKDLMIVTFKA